MKLKILNRINRTTVAKTRSEVKTKTKWAKFTYVGLQTKFITKLLEPLI